MCLSHGGGAGEGEGEAQADPPTECGSQLGLDAKALRSGRELDQLNRPDAPFVRRFQTMDSTALVTVGRLSHLFCSEFSPFASPRESVHVLCVTEPAGTQLSRFSHVVLSALSPFWFCW